MILVDLKGHMVSDTSVAELHAFAEGMGLKRWGFHGGRRHPHYDLITASKLLMALESGAVYATTRMIVKQRARR